MKWTPRAVMGRWGGALVAFALLSVGCAGGAGPAAGPGSAVVHDLRVLTSPAPVAMRQGGGARGVWAQVYALTRGQTRAVALPPGRLELLLFDGSVSRADLDDHEPYLRFAHRSDELSAAASTTVAGVRYTLPVQWGERVPETGVVTLIVRFAPDEGEPVHAPPVSIRLGPA